MYGGALGGLWRHHLRAHWGLYVVVIGVMAIGITVGAIGAKVLPAGQVEELQSRLVDAFQGLDTGVNYRSLATFAVLRNLQAIGLILFLGLTVLGFPLILAFLFFRGFVLGFTVGFLLLTRPNDGVLVVFLTLLPSNLVFLPTLAVSGVVALAFSLWLVRGRQTGSLTLGNALLLYFGLSLGTLTVAAGAGLIDAYVAPSLLRLFFH